MTTLQSPSKLLRARAGLALKTTTRRPAGTKIGSLFMGFGILVRRSELLDIVVPSRRLPVGLMMQCSGTEPAYWHITRPTFCGSRTSASIAFVSHAMRKQENSQDEFLGRG